MESLITIMEPFFLYPSRAYHIRELAKIIGLSHTAVRKKIHQLVKQEYVIEKKTTPFSTFIAAQTQQFYNLKLYCNLERLRTSGVLKALEKYYEYPTLVLFGSYARSLDDEHSDIDICVLSEKNSAFDILSFEKHLHRHISLHLFTASQWQLTKDKNPELINSICNGITLSGQLEAL